MTIRKKSIFFRDLIDPDQVAPLFPLAVNLVWEFNPMNVRAFAARTLRPTIIRGDREQ
jgi:hypothetical protein